MAELYANSADFDQTPHSAASDLGLQKSIMGGPDLKKS